MNNNANAPRQYIPIEIERITCTIYAVCASLAIIKKKKKSFFFFSLNLFFLSVNFHHLCQVFAVIFPQQQKKKRILPFDSFSSCANVLRFLEGSCCILTKIFPTFDS